MLVTLQRRAPQQLAAGRCLSVLLCCMRDEADGREGGEAVGQGGAGQGGAAEAVGGSGAIAVQGGGAGQDDALGGVVAGSGEAAAGAQKSDAAGVRVVLHICLVSDDIRPWSCFGYARGERTRITVSWFTCERFVLVGVCMGLIGTAPHSCDSCVGLLGTTFECVRLRAPCIKTPRSLSARHRTTIPANQHVRRPLPCHARPIPQNAQMSEPLPLDTASPSSPERVTGLSFALSGGSHTLRGLTLGRSCPSCIPTGSSFLVMTSPGVRPGVVPVVVGPVAPEAPAAGKGRGSTGS